MSDTIHRLNELVQHTAENIKAVVTVAGSTITAGAATLFDKLPVLLGTTASIVGIILSLVLIRKITLEINELKAREAERLDAAAKSPCRRSDDKEVTK